MAKMTKDDVKNLFTEAQGAKSGGDFPTFPVGRYKGKLSKCEYYETKTGKRYVRHFWTILEGEYEGKDAMDYRRAENAKGIGITLSEWEKLGVETSGVSDYDTLAELAEKVQALGAVCSFRIAQSKTDERYQNFWIDELIETQGVDGEDDGEDEASAKAAEEGTPEEDDNNASIDVGDMVEFKHDGKTMTKAVVAIDEDNGIITVKIGKDKVGLTISDIIRKVEE